MREIMKKTKENRGFTLAELLVVVAIIAVLIAIMIPVFSSSLAKSNHAVNTANIRAAYAEAVTTALANDDMAPSGTVDVIINMSDVDTKGSGSVKFESNAITVTTNKPVGNALTSTFKVDSEVTVSFNTKGTTTASWGGN